MHNFDVVEYEEDEEDQIDDDDDKCDDDPDVEEDVEVSKVGFLDV